MRKLLKETAGALLAGSVALAAAAEIPVDLNSWQQRGPAANGNWIVSTDGNSVLQTINGNPTFFVSPTNQFNTTIRGTLKVETALDDDYIGFVLGFKGPTSTGNDMDFILFDWKQAQQQWVGGYLAAEGFTLSRVHGTITDYVPGFSSHQGDGFTVLDTLYGSDYGWLDDTEYAFQILYQANRIKINIAGGQFGSDGLEVFDIAGTFADGRFGFYNYSQQDVRYAGLTQEDTPPSGDVPIPAPLALLGIGMLAFGFRRLRSQEP